MNAGKPELALAAYTEASMWQDAMRLAKRHLPHKLSEVNMAHQRAIFSGGPKSKEELLEACEIWVSCQQYVQAIDAYLSITNEQLDVRHLLRLTYFYINFIFDFFCRIQQDLKKFGV